MDWMLTGVISNAAVRMDFHPSPGKHLPKDGLKMEHKGILVGPNHAAGSHRVHAGTNVYFSGTWDLVRISTNSALRMVAPKPPDPQPKPGE